MCTPCRVFHGLFHPHVEPMGFCVSSVSLCEIVSVLRVRRGCEVIHHFSAALECAHIVFKSILRENSLKSFNHRYDGRNRVILKCGDRTVEECVHMWVLLQK